VREVKEVKECQLAAGFVAQPLLAVRFLRLSGVYRRVKVEKTAQPRVAVLQKPSGIFVGRDFSRDIQETNLGPFRP
jgi:hypothetical protein